MSHDDEALEGVRLPPGDLAIDATIRRETYGVSRAARDAAEAMAATRRGHLPELTATDGTAASTSPSAAAGGQALTTRLLRLSSAPPRAAGGERGERPADLELVRVLGEGGMGRVLLARQSALAREVAVKVLRPDVVDAGAEAQLLAEAWMTGALEHPNVVPVHLLGSDAGGRPALVMKRVEGVAWRELLEDAAHPMWQQLPYHRGDQQVAHLEILMQVCNGLQYAHSRGLLHRDVKPDNVMVGSFGEVYLMDWGIAISVEEARVVAPEEERPGPVGTPAYMAPEMVRAGALDERTDVFLLGAVLHEVLARRYRHEGKTLAQVLMAALHPRPVTYDPDVAEELGALANRATAESPDDRPATVAAFRAAIADSLSHRSSMDLVRAARAILAEMSAAAAPPATGERDPAATEARVERLAVECRFGFVQALKAWPGNEDARRGLRALLSLLFRRAIGRMHLHTARSLLAELPEPDAALEAELAAAEARAGQQREEQARLDGIASANDLRVAGAQRRRFFGTIAVVALLWNVASFGARLAGYRTFSARGVVLFGVAFAATVTALMIYSRRALFRNSINRRVAVLPVVATWALFAHRAQAVLRGHALEQIVADDLILLGVGASVAAVLLARAYALIAAVFFVGAACAVLVPDWAQQCFSLAGLVALLLVFGYWWRSPGGDARA